MLNEKCEKLFDLTDRNKIYKEMVKVMILDFITAFMNENYPNESREICLKAVVNYIDEWVDKKIRDKNHVD